MSHGDQPMAPASLAAVVLSAAFCFALDWQLTQLGDALAGILWLAPILLVLQGLAYRLLDHADDTSTVRGLWMGAAIGHVLFALLMLWFAVLGAALTTTIS